MERLYRSFSRTEFEILAVSTDAQGSAVTRPFQQEAGFTFPVLHDADFRIGLRYGARQLPMTFLIDRKGVIRNRIPAPEIGIHRRVNGWSSRSFRGREP